MENTEKINDVCVTNFNGSPYLILGHESGKVSLYDKNCLENEQKMCSFKAYQSRVKKL